MQYAVNYEACHLHLYSGKFNELFSDIVDIFVTASYAHFIFHRKQLSLFMNSYQNHIYSTF